jgi:hypothetical protein
MRTPLPLDCLWSARPLQPRSRVRRAARPLAAPAARAPPRPAPRAAAPPHVVERPLERLRRARLGLVRERRLGGALLEQAAADERVQRVDRAVLQRRRELQRPQQGAALGEDGEVVEHHCCVLPAGAAAAAGAGARARRVARARATPLLLLRARRLPAACARVAAARRGAMRTGQRLPHAAPGGLAGPRAPWRAPASGLPTHARATTAPFSIPPAAAHPQRGPQPFTHLRAPFGGRHAMGESRLILSGPLMKRTDGAMGSRACQEGREGGGGDDKRGGRGTRKLETHGGPPHLHPPRGRHRFWAAPSRAKAATRPLFAAPRGPDRLLPASVRGPARPTTPRARVESSATASGRTPQSR